MKSTKKKGLRVGITGGIGTGKSTVCRIFESLGVPVYDADYWARWLLSNDPALKSAIVEIFGPEAYSENGTYNRQLVAQQAFSNPEKLAALNAVAHPAVEAHARAWHEAKAAEGHPYTLKEAALMVESGSYKHLDCLIVISAPENLRIERVVKRDGISEAQVRARMQHQLPEQKKLDLADFIIVNDGQNSLIRQAWETHQSLLEQSKK
jgi:dephospho-CoA kinase